MITISVIIPTQNKCRSLMRTLAALEKFERGGTEFEVIVVDDASTDDTEGWLANHRPLFPLQCIRRNQKFGPASARNRGAELASGKILLFLDDDMECGSETLEAHLAHHRSGDDVAVVGRAIYHPELRRNALTRYFDSQNLRQGSSSCPPIRLCSNNLSLSRSLFYRAGCFDELLTRVGLEDVELGFRLSKIPGCRLRYEPKAWAYHYHDQSLRDYVRKVHAAGEKNLGILASKFPEELNMGALGWLISRPTDGYSRIALRALLSLPVADALVPLAEIAPGDRLNRILVKVTLASSMLRGYRRSLDSTIEPAKHLAS